MDALLFKNAAPLCVGTHDRETHIAVVVQLIQIDLVAPYLPEQFTDRFDPRLGLNEDVATTTTRLASCVCTPPPMSRPCE